MAQRKEDTVIMMKPKDSTPYTPPADVVEGIHDELKAYELWNGEPLELTQAREHWRRCEACAPKFAAQFRPTIPPSKLVLALAFMVPVFGIVYALVAAGLGYDRKAKEALSATAVGVVCFGLAVVLIVWALVSMGVV